jgi:hypothetical protein
LPPSAKALDDCAPGAASSLPQEYELQVRNTGKQDMFKNAERNINEKKFDQISIYNIVYKN